MNELFFTIADVHVRVTTNRRDHYDFLSKSFEQCAIKKEPEEGFDVSIEIRWQTDKIAPFSKEKNISRIGASTASGEGYIATVKKIHGKWKVGYELRLESDQLSVRTSVQQKPLQEFLRYSLRGKSREEWFYTLNYHLIYYPVFYYLEDRRQTHVLHASSIRYNDSGLLICSLEGLGKTTLALRFLQDGASFVSDNLVFYNNEEVMPCYELLRIHRREEHLYQNILNKVNSSSILKGFFQPRFDIDNRPLKPDILIFPEFADAFKVTQISGEEAINRAISLSHLPQELNDYAEYRHLFNLLNIHFSPWQSAYNVLYELLKDTRCYRVAMVEKEGIENNYRHLKESLWGRS